MNVTIGSGATVHQAYENGSAKCNAWATTRKAANGAEATCKRCAKVAAADAARKVETVEVVETVTETVEVVETVTETVEVVETVRAPGRKFSVTVEYTDSETGRVQEVTDWYGSRSTARRAVAFAQGHPHARLVGHSPNVLH